MFVRAPFQELAAPILPAAMAFPAPMVLLPISAPVCWLQFPSCALCVWPIPARLDSRFQVVVWSLFQRLYALLYSFDA